MRALPDAEILPLSGLERATHVFGLDSTERTLLAALVAAEVSREGPRPETVAELLLLAGLTTAAQSALAPTAALRRFALVTLEGRGPLASRRICADAAFWPRLTDPRAAPVRTIDVPDPHLLDGLVLDEATRRAADAAAAEVARALALQSPHVIAIVGPHGSGRRTLALAIAGKAGAASLVVERLDLETGSRLAVLRREATWYRAAVIVPPVDPSASIEPLLGNGSPLIVIGDHLPLESWADHVDIAVVEVERPVFAARKLLWRRALAEADDATIDRLAGRSVGPGRIGAIARIAEGRGRATGASAVAERVLAWAARIVGAGDLHQHAQRLESSYSREDLVAPPDTSRDLEVVFAAARQHAGRVEAWRADGRGELPGLACLFAGPSGTGKTMVAQIIGRELGVDVYRVDLSQVVSKYIGETEKNLGKVFDAAAQTGVILFFDEADALFGKRTTVESAHDRYANTETGYLLQRIEGHDGLSILATNLRANLDDAFVRRLLFIVDFALPGVEERKALWLRYLPADRASDIDVVVASRFSLSGGDIRNAALTAELLAGGAGGVVEMQHVVVAIAITLRKHGRLISPAEFGSWAGAVTAFLRRP